MDGFKNTTKMKYMCGGPVRKATGGAIKSVAPKSVAKSAASAKQLPTPDLGSKRFIDKTRPEPIREAPRPTMEPKRLIAQTPPEDKGRELPRPTVEPKRQVHPTPPKNSKTMGGAPKDAKTIGGAAQAMAGASRDAKTIGGMTMGKSPLDGLTKSPMTGPLGSVAKNPPKGGAALSKMARSVAGTGQKESPTGGAPKKATAAPRGMETLKAMGSVGVAKKGVPVASNKPMIGFKTGGHVTKSMTKW